MYYNPIYFPNEPMNQPRINKPWFIKIRGGIPPIVILWYFFYVTFSIKQPFGVYQSGFDIIS